MAKSRKAALLLDHPPLLLHIPNTITPGTGRTVSKTLDLKKEKLPKTNMAW